MTNSTTTNTNTTERLKYGKFRLEMEQFYNKTNLATNERILTGEHMNDSQILKAYSKYRHLRVKYSMLNRVIEDSCI